MATKRTKPAGAQRTAAKQAATEVQSVFDRLFGLGAGPAKPDIFEKRYDKLLARRVPSDAIVLGRAYVIHARNGGVGVAVREDGRVGYCLHREKWDEHFLFTEWDWA